VRPRLIHAMRMRRLLYRPVGPASHVGLTALNVLISACMYSDRFEALAQHVK